MANKGQWRNQKQATNTKNKKKKKPEQNRFGKKGQSQARQKNAEKTGSNKLNKTGNSRADERREGAVRAQKNPVNVMRSGAQNYIIKDKVQGVATTPTKAVSGAIKNAQNGVVRTAGGGNTRSNERLTNVTQKKRYEANVKKEQERRKQIEKTKKENEKNGYKYGNGIVKALDKYNKTVDKKFEDSKKKDLDYGASVLPDKKVDIPVYSKYAKGKAEKEAKAALKEGGVTQKKGKENVDNWIANTEKEWKSQGYDVKDDVVVTEDGKTWGDIKKEAYDQEAARIRFERSKYIHQSADNAGKMSAQDLYKGGVEMASEFIDYGVPYMATAKGSIKVAEKILAKAAKAGKAGTKSVPKIEHAVEDLVKNGTLSPKAAAKLNRKIALKSGAKSFSTEFVANALQDATIGTALDLGKGVSQGLRGEELQKYMKDNAIANLALGLPMSGIAGRAGAKEAKAAMSMDYAKAINDAVNITKPEAIKLENLLKKQEKGTITGAETEALKGLQEKALGEGQAVVNSKGKIEANKTSFAADDLTKEEATEYFKLKAQTERGSIDSRDIPRFNELRGKVESAYRAAEVNAERTINVSGRKVTSAMQENAESAVRFYERTGDTAKLKQAQSVLEKAQKATVAKNEALATNIEKMNDVTKGNYRWVDSAEMENLTGDGRLGGYYDEATGEIVVNRDSPQAYQTVVGHETMHMLKAANREGYDKLANMLKDYVKELGDGQYDSLVAEVKRAYPELVAKGDVDALDEELVSEMLGRYVFGEDDKFIKRLAKEDPSTLQKIIDYIKKLFADNKNEELAKQLSNLEETALEEIRKINPSAIEKGGDAKVKSSRFGIKGATEEQRELGIEAEKMFKDGKTPEEIWNKTGVIVDTDGKAKWEFSDKDMKFKFKMSDLKGKNRLEEGRLEDLLEHEELFKRYPKLKGVQVEILPRRYLDGADGEYLNLGAFKLIRMARGQSKEEMYDTIIHEIQHAIQEEEGFARGSSPEYYDNVMANLGKSIDEFESKFPDYTFERAKDGSYKVYDKEDRIVDLDEDNAASIEKIKNAEPLFTYDPKADEVTVNETKMQNVDNALVDGFEKYVEDSEALFKLYEAYKADKFEYGIDDTTPSMSAYRHTKGEGEAEDTVDRRKFTQEELDRTPRFEDEQEIMREDFDKYYGESGGKKMSKFSKEVKTAREKKASTDKAIAELDEKFNGKLSTERRKQLEERRRTLEKQREEERRELNKLNRPLYEERLKEAEEELAKLEAQRKRTKGKEKLKELDNKIRATKGKITRNKNLIENEPKKYVSDTPVKELKDSKLKYEYHDLQEKLRDETWQDILERDAIEERIEAIRKEADKRGVEVRDTLELADEVIKEKRFGWQDAKRLSNEIKDLNKKIDGIRNNEKWTKANREKKSRKVGELAKEVKAKEKRLYQIVENSKSVVPEGKSAKETFNDVVGGNTLKEKGSGKKLNKMSVKNLIEENGSAGGALRDVGKMIRRKGESSLIEYESAAKQLIKNGQKEVGQALLDQVNNVIVYKNKAAAAVESRRANADGTKIGKSLNDVFKVKDKNGKIVDLLLEENTEMRQDLSNYLFAKHSFAREEQGKKVFGIIGEDGKPKWTNASTQEFMDEIIRDYGRETVESFEREIRDFINYLNEYRLDTGLVSKELLDKLNDIYPYYIPTNRAVLNKPPKEYELPKSTAEVENGIKRAVGGDAPLEDLYTQLAKMTMATIRSGEQNKLLSMYAKAHDIEATRLPKDATADDVLESSVEAFNSDHKGNWKVRFYQNGESVTIPVNKHAAKGLREFNGQDYATLMEVSAKAGQLFHLREYKGFITDWNVVFGVRNGMRDAQQALVNSKDTMWYSRSIPRAMSAVANENNAFRILYDANGGRYSTLQQINRLDEIGALNKNKSTVAKGLEKIEDFNGAIEMMPRMCEFIGTIQKEAERLLGKDGVNNLMREIEAQAKIKPEAERTAWIESEYAQRVVDLIKKKKPDIIATAIRNSSDITVNFSRHGVITRALNAGFVPYLNPSVQGLSKMARMFTESKAEGLGKLACFGAKLSVLTIAPSMVNEILCQGNEAYQSLNSRDKDNAFFIPMSLFGGEKDKFIKIPKPRENAVLAEPFEYGLRYFLDKAQYGTLDEFKQMFESANTNIGIVNVWEDNIFSPIVNTATNKTWYGGDILSKQELENIDNEEAWKNYDETTSLLAKKIGKTMNWSPKKVDNIMDSYLGLIYDFGISQTSQKNINDVYSSPKNFLKHNPIVQQFAKDAVFSNKYATKFWDRVDELNKGHKGDKDTIEKREYTAKYGYDTFTYDTAISNIDNDKNIPKTERVEMKRELRKYKNQLLNRALKGEDVKCDPMQRIINLYKAHGIKNATDVCLSQYAEGDHAEAYKHLKQSKEYRDATDAEKKEWQQKFLKTYKGVKRIARFTGDSDNFVNYSTVEYVCVKNGYTKGHIANMYAWKSKEYAVEKGLKDMQKYIDAGYTEKNFKITMRAMNRGADALGDPDKQYASQLDDYDKAMICAKNGYRDGAYLVASPYIGKARMNAGRCLVEGHSGEDYKWTDKRINKFCKKYAITADKNHKWDLEQVAEAVRKEYGGKTPEEQAAVYTVITGDTENNPFGEIGDYSHKNDSGLLEGEDKKGKGGRGRRRGRRGGGGGGGSGKGKVPSTDTGAIKGKVTDPFSTTNGSKASNLDDTYRKKVRKLRSQLNK